MNKYIKRIVGIAVLTNMLISLLGCGAEMNNVSLESNISSEATENVEVFTIEGMVESGTEIGVDEGEMGETTIVDPTTLNSLAMLNYLTMVSQEICSTDGGRLFLEEVYDSLHNNINPEKVDETTLYYINNLTDIIKGYELVGTKRNRLRLIYELDKADTIRQAVPNPMSIISIAGSLDWKRLLVAVAYTAVDSYNRYKNANDALDKEYMTDGWELDDQEEGIIHNNNKYAFTYMVNIVNEKHVPGIWSLSQKAVERFAENVDINTEDRDAVYSKLQFLISEEETYSKFGPYWLEKADCYFEIGNYEQCLECLQEYNELYTGIFRKDYNCAKFLPKAIIAAQNVFEDDEDRYIEVISLLTRNLADNSDADDWGLKYFAAQSYIDLYQKNPTNNVGYLKNAYDLLVDNVRMLVPKQEEINNTYIADLVPLELEPMNETVYMSDSDKESLLEDRKEKQEKLDEINSALEEGRKTELPTLYTPLILNCELLLAVINKLPTDQITPLEKDTLEGILHTNNNGAFFSDVINNFFCFTSKTSQVSDITLNKEKLCVPAGLLVDESIITAVITKVDGTIHHLDNWLIQEVTRPEKDVSSFEAYYACEEMKTFRWDEGDVIEFTISMNDICEPISVSFTVSSYKKNWWNENVPEFLTIERLQQYFDKIEFEKNE